MRYGRGTLIPEPAAQVVLTPELLTTPRPFLAGTPLEFMQISRIPAVEPFGCWRD
jgi:hypothetical protein